MSIDTNDPALLISAAEAGDAFAQFHLAEAYREGDFVPQDYEAALRWYLAAALQDHADAQNNVGSMYLNGMGTPRNVAEALRWYREAAQQGQVDAELNLGIRFRTGDGVPPDEHEAFEWFLRSALGGCPEGMLEVGTAYELGRGTAQSLLDAAQWHIDAAERGNVFAMGRLSDYREDLERLALEGDLSAAYWLARMYEGGYGVEHDDAMAYAWVRWAVRRGKREIDDDFGNCCAWLENLRAELSGEEQQRGLRAFNRLALARDALHRDWTMATA
ncbi:MAG: tetratricopeptide repeat protein [Burkholderiales bacterium]